MSGRVGGNRREREADGEFIQVVARLRPLTMAERKNSASNKASIRVLNDQQMYVSDGASRTKEYVFDRICTEVTTQEQLFNSCVQPVVEEVMKGFSCTVFAYGQTGTGKTYTMEGFKTDEGYVDETSDEAGIIPRAINYVFDFLKNSPQIIENNVKISFLEIYNEKLDDLLSPEQTMFQQDSMDRGAPRGLSDNPISSPTFSPAPRFAMSERLKIVTDEKQGTRVAGLEEITIHSPKMAFEFLKRGFAKRATVGTRCNAQSSRSHCVFTMTITMKEFLDGQDIMRVGKLNLVDLAGSENVGRSGATDRRAREAGNINQSLLTLGRVINSLNDGVSWVPYRDSKLTRLLQDSLGGKSKTCMIATLSPSTENLEETLSTLDYAARAKKIKNKPEQFMRLEKRDMMVQAYKELERLRERFRAQIDAQDGMIFVKEDEYEAVQARVETLEAEIEALGEVHAKTRMELETTQEELMQTQEALEDMTHRALEAEAELARKTQELEEKIQELETEKIRHAETQAISKAKGHTETLLTEQMHALFGTLQSSVRDVTGLKLKVDRNRAQIQEHVDVAGEYKRTASEQVDELLRISNEFHGIQSSLCITLSTRLSELVATNQEDALQISSILTNAQTLLQEFLKSSTAEMQAFSDTMGDHTSTGGVTANADLSAISTMLSNFNDDISARISATNSILSQKEAFWNAWVFELISAFQGVAVNVENFRKQHTASLQSLSGLIQLETSKLEQTFNAQKESVASFQKKSIEQMHEAREALLKSVTKAMQTFTSTQENMINSETSTLTASIQRSSAAVTALHTSTTAQITSLEEKCNTWSNAAQDTAKVSEAQVKTNDEVFKKHLVNATSNVQQTQTIADEFIDIATQASRTTNKNTLNTLESISTAVSAYTASASEQLHMFHTKAEQEVNSADASVKKAQNTVQTSVQEQQVPLVHSIGTNADASYETNGMFGASMKEGIQKLTEHDIKPEKVTGSSPKVTGYSIPPSIPNTAPELSVLSNFRRALAEEYPPEQVDYHTYGFRTNVPFQSVLLDTIEASDPLPIHNAENLHVFPEVSDVSAELGFEQTDEVVDPMTLTHSFVTADDETEVSGEAVVASDSFHSVDSAAMNPFDSDSEESTDPSSSSLSPSTPATSHGITVDAERPSDEVVEQILSSTPATPTTSTTGTTSKASRAPQASTGSGSGASTNTSFVTPTRRKDGIVPSAVHQIETRMSKIPTPRQN